MKSFAVIGLGRFGSNLACRLSELGGEVLAVDENMECVEAVSDYVTQAVAGDCREEKVLKSLGITNFDCAVVAISDDVESSILITSLLKSIGVGFVVAKAVSDLHGKVLRQVGADKVVFPEKDMGMKLAQSLRTTNILDFIEISDEYSIIEMKMPSAWVGKTLAELDVRRKYGINIVAIKDHKTELIDVSPNPNMPLDAEKLLVLIGANDDIEKLPK